MRLEGFALFGGEALEQCRFAFCAKRLDLLRGEGLLRNRFVEVAALAVVAATVEVLPIGFLDGAFPAFGAHERSGRRGCASLCRR